MKPKYNIRKNFFYATDGAKELLKEGSFRIEITAFVLAIIVLLFLPYPIWAKLFMFASLFTPLIAEAFNTTIEKIVDITAPEYHILAKHAKDIAAFGVFMSIFIPLFTWFAFVVYFK